MYKRQGVSNAQLDDRAIRTHCALSATNQQLLESAMDHLRLSARATHRILRIARTIADLDSEKNINTKHLTEAINYRRLNLH